MICFKKISDNISGDCRNAYDCFLRSQVYNDHSSHLLGNLPKEKQRSIFAFADHSKYNNIHKRIHLTKNIRENVELQEKLMQVIIRS